MVGMTFDDVEVVSKSNGGVLTFDDVEPVKTRAEKNYIERVGDAAEMRRQQVLEAEAAQQAGEQGPVRTYFQQFGRGGLGFVNDIIGEGVVSAGRGLSAITPDVIEQPIREGAANVAGFIGDTPAADYARQAAQGIGAAYSQFAENNPAIARDIGAATNIGLLGLSAVPIRGGQSVAGALAKGAGAGAKAAGKVAALPVKGAVKATIGTVKGVNAGLEKVGQMASEAVIKSNLPKDLRGMPYADALFMRTLVNEGISPDDAVAAMSKAREFGATPSVAASANVPSMKEMGFLMGRGSQGSKVAANAIKDIEDVQIPRLNEEIIKRATGGTSATAEAYGQQVSKLAKDTIDAQKTRLANRAKPYYQQSVGVDKSLDVANPSFQKALTNPLVVKALDDARVDSFTLTNVQKELAELGVEAGDITRLPYNSTVSLHAARTHLRGLSDSAFAAGEKQKGRAIKSALADIDEAIESQFPEYKQARAIYSEDAGALRVLNESPMGAMAKMGDGDLSKIANQFMTKDPQFINKFFAKAKAAGVDEEKLRQSIAGVYLKRKLEDATKEGLRFSDAALKNQTTRNQLRAVVGQEKFDKIQAINDVIDELNETRGMVQGSRTSAVQAIRDEASDAVIPTSRGELLMQLKAKYTPSLIDIVKNNPKSAARFNELLFTDEGFKLLESLKGKKSLTVGDQNKLSKFLQREKVK